MQPVSPTKETPRSCPQCGRPFLTTEDHVCRAPHGTTFAVADRERPPAQTTQTAHTSQTTPRTMAAAGGSR